MADPIIINGQKVVITFDPNTGTTSVVFPNVYLDNGPTREPVSVSYTPTIPLAYIIAAAQFLLEQLGYPA